MGTRPLSSYLISLPTPSGKCCDVRPMREGESFGLGDSERALFDSVAQEHVGIVGTDFEYFSQNLQKATVDPLYNEPARRVFDGPYLMKGYLSYPEHGPNVGMEGFTSSFDATAYITRAAFEAANLSSPAEADIVRVWNTAYWNMTSVDGYPVPGAGLYFSIVDVKEDSVLFDTPSFLGFTLTLRRVTQQTPERKITNTL